ncbi:MAG TPA: zinc-dependent metalloprotease [Candidatus Limnocylindrales bacterium]|nr:zinc-dependent metalloprotease [Candidatus Limnocylindrales bacterium]
MSDRTAATATRRAESAARRRNDRAAIGVGIALGAAGLAIASRYISKRAQQTSGDGLVDWTRVEQMAVARLRRTPGALPAHELRAAESAYASAMAEVVPLLERQLGQPLPGVVERHEVVDRAGWARANITTFASLIDRLEPHVRSATPERGLASDVAKLANRFITTQQVGFLLGYLGTRVLGQYDIALLSAEAKPGKLLFVEENIRATAATLGVPIDDFRRWIVLHEATHAFEFEANSWLRPYLRDHLERQLAGVFDQARNLQSDGIGNLIRRLRESQDNPIAAFLTPEQRLLFDETQRVMSLLEGFSDWVMDEAGAQLLPDVESIRTRFETRRNQRRGNIDRLVARLTGLDMKLEQYRRGERFVAGVAAAGGRAAVTALWSGPWALPSEAEMADPEAWVRRVIPDALTEATPANA